jgi:hypothetical protein
VNSPTKNCEQKVSFNTRAFGRIAAFAILQDLDTKNMGSELICFANTTPVAQSLQVVKKGHGY